jgi:hypothetical protein
MYGTSRTTASQLLVNHCADIGIQARAFIPGFDQRSDITFVSDLDLKRAYTVGFRAVERLHKGESDFLSSISKTNESSVYFTSVPFSEIDDYSRSLHLRWIWHGNYDVTDEYLEYVGQLIGKEPVHIPGFPTGHNFAFQRCPATAKKLEPWNGDCISEAYFIETEKNTKKLSTVDSVIN